MRLRRWKISWISIFCLFITWDANKGKGFTQRNCSFLLNVCLSVCLPKLIFFPGSCSCSVNRELKRGLKWRRGWSSSIVAVEGEEKEADASLGRRRRRRRRRSIGAGSIKLVGQLILLFFSRASRMQLTEKLNLSFAVRKRVSILWFLAGWLAGWLPRD